MDKKRIITIAGRPGSGKSTASRGVAEQLGYEHFSSGDMFRAMGRERGVDVLQTNIAAKKEKELDFVVDERLRQIGETQQDVAIDSRLAWHWIPDSFKVFLDLDLEIAAIRILQKTDPERFKNENIPNNPKKYAEVLKKRLDSETERYKDLYRVDPYDMEHYDLVIDTDANNPEQTINKILDAYHAWLAR